VYVMDTSSFIVMGHFFPERFPSFWLQLNNLADQNLLVSVSEVWKELENRSTRSHLASWVDSRRALFTEPSSAEMEFVREIFAVPSFQSLVRRKSILEGSPVADPWVIARAAILTGCVVTEEADREDAVRIPAVCRHFDVECTTLEGMMQREGWQY
jgi:hypothetical protein